NVVNRVANHGEPPVVELAYAGGPAPVFQGATVVQASQSTLQDTFAGVDQVSRRPVVSDTGGAASARDRQPGVDKEASRRGDSGTATQGHFPKLRSVPAGNVPCSTLNELSPFPNPGAVLLNPVAIAPLLG